MDRPASIPQHIRDSLSDEARAIVGTVVDGLERQIACKPSSLPQANRGRDASPAGSIRIAPADSSTIRRRRAGVILPSGLAGEPGPASPRSRSNIAAEVPNAAVTSGAVPERHPVSLPSRPLPGP